jgi:hypothetical protein
MGKLATQFGGKVSGELIRAEVWNGLVAGIEGELEGLESRSNVKIGELENRVHVRIGTLEAQLNGRIAALEPRVTALEARFVDISESLAPLQELASSLLARQRRIDLSATRVTFAVGERAEIVARISDLLGKPLNLADEPNLPSIDFVTVWGTLKAAPGFTSVAGTGGRSITVKVNAAGEARVLLRAEGGEDLAEEHEQEVAAVLETKVGTRSVARTILDATTPGSTDLAPAFAAVTSAYQQATTPVMRNYLDARYLAKPARSYTPLTSGLVLNWHDDHATVLAFLKPDDSPGTADGAMAVGSIRVAFRNWTDVWTHLHFLPVKPEIIATYTNLFLPKVRDSKGIAIAVDGMWDVIADQTRNRGILGSQREFAGAQAALAGLNAPNPPAYMPGLVQAVGSGLAIQRSLLYGQAVAPMVAEDVVPARGISQGSVRGEAAVLTAESAAAIAVAAAKEETRKAVTQAEARIMTSVTAETTKFSNELFKEGGRVSRAETLAAAARAEVSKVNVELGRKAGVDLVGSLLNPRIRGT